MDQQNTKEFKKIRKNPNLLSKLFFGYVQKLKILYIKN